MTNKCGWNGVGRLKSGKSGKSGKRGKRKRERERNEAAKKRQGNKKKDSSGLYITHPHPSTHQSHSFFFQAEDGIRYGRVTGVQTCALPISKIHFADGQKVKTNDVLLEWDPYTFSILTEVSGVVHFKDLAEGMTMQEQVDEITGRSQWVVMESTDEKRIPTMIVRPQGGGKHEEKRYLMPMHAHLTVTDGDEVHAGDVLAKIPRATTKTKDITGGLPRVVELFEARKPRETAVITEIDGTVKYGEIAKGMRKLYIVGDDGVQKEYSIPRGVHINVQEGERVRSGDPLMDGPRNPHDILAVLGEKELQK